MALCLLYSTNRRTKNALKLAPRGGGRDRHELSPSQIAGPEDSHDLLALDEALIRLDKEDHEAAERVKLRYFAGLCRRR